MKCPKCNIYVSDDSQFCSNCGVKIYENNEDATIPKFIQNNKSDSNFELNQEVKMVGRFIFAIILVMGALIAIGARIPFEIISISVFLGVCILAWELAPKAKNIVVSIGRKTLDFLTILDVFLCVIVIILGFIQCVSKNGISSLLCWYILGAVVLFFGTLLANYALYLLIDIRNSLKILSDKKGK